MQFLIGALLILFNNPNGYYFNNTLNTSAETKTERLAADSVEMVFVEGGTFSMGCEGGTKCQEHHIPLHDVTLNSFYISKYEITKKQFAEFVAKTSYRTMAEKKGYSIYRVGNNNEKKTGLDWKNQLDVYAVGNADLAYPVIHVSWNDAVEYCRWLSKETGKKYRLPTEAEWEYAARGGVKNQGYKFAGSNNADSVAWYDDNSQDKIYPVGQKKPNELGIYDMSGNVWEFCSDWFTLTYEGSLIMSNNPLGPENGLGHVKRGGSSRSLRESTLNYSRSMSDVNYNNDEIGFRIVMEP